MESGSGGSACPMLIPIDVQECTLEALDETILEEDVGLLMRQGNEMANDCKSALKHRIGVKRALKKLGYGLLMTPPPF